MSLEGAIAAHRFGLGARPGEIDRASRNPKAWLKSQINTPADQLAPLGGGTFKNGGELVVEMLQYQRDRAMERRNGGGADPVKMFFKVKAQEFLDELAARYAHGFTTDRPFAERLVWFWSNHFVVSAQNPRATTLVGAFEREAIRPHITAKFEDMLLAVTSHPAMLLYLDNAQSIGPHSRAGEFAGKGLNENLGRELMELYTLGVDGGYTQADVIGMAKILTGWSLSRDGQNNGFAYFENRHEPGDVTLRGRTYPPTLDGGVAAIKDLAHDPATARHIARKMATHFIADDPPAESVARLEKTFNETGGDLRALAHAVVDDANAWKPGPGKMRTPVEYVTAGYRLLNLPKGDNTEKQVRGAVAATRLMGQTPLSPPAPKGWPDTSDAWSGPDAVLTRIEWAQQVGQKIPPGFDSAAIAEMGVGPLLQPATKTAMAQAESQSDALALLLSSPEFQRR
ncbi:MAG: DUF1800 domain-containing protein [Rhizomicrobium sp.]